MDRISSSASVGHVLHGATDLPGGRVAAMDSARSGAVPVGLSVASNSASLLAALMDRDNSADRTGHSASVDHRLRGATGSPDGRDNAADLARNSVLPKGHLAVSPVNLGVSTPSVNLAGLVIRVQPPNLATRAAMDSRADAEDSSGIMHRDRVPSAPMAMRTGNVRHFRAASAMSRRSVPTGLAAVNSARRRKVAVPDRRRCHHRHRRPPLLHHRLRLPRLRQRRLRPQLLAPALPSRNPASNK